MEFWNSRIRLKQAAVGSLAIGLAFIAVVLAAGQRMSAIQKPIYNRHGIVHRSFAAHRIRWGPVLWAAIGPKMDIRPSTLYWAIFDWFVLSLIAAADVFNFSRRDRELRAAASTVSSGA